MEASLQPRNNPVGDGGILLDVLPAASIRTLTPRSSIPSSVKAGVGVGLAFSSLICLLATLALCRNHETRNYKHQRKTPHAPTLSDIALNPNHPSDIPYSRLKAL